MATLTTTACENQPGQQLSQHKQITSRSYARLLFNEPDSDSIEKVIMKNETIDPLENPVSFSYTLTPFSVRQSAEAHFILACQKSRKRLN